MQNLVKDILKYNMKKSFNNKIYKNLAILMINRSHSNIFITLTDLKKKVIICKSSGGCSVSNFKKHKKSPQIIENIIESLSFYFELYKIKNFYIILKVRFSSHIVILVKELTDRGYNIKRYFNQIKIAHNGTRGRKPRRI